MTGLRNTLMENGFDPKAAFNFARMALSQKGVTIGKNGKVHYKGAVYNAVDFAQSPLVKWVSGQTAKAKNEAAIKADPNYQLALANLGLARDQTNAGLDAQQRQSLLEFGDPSFVQNDPSLAAAAGANPFGTSQLLARAYQAQQNEVRNTANRAGTLFGGGYGSGMMEAQHQYAGQNYNATSALQNLLDSISMQKAQAGQSYDLGSRSALLQTQQNLAAAGTLSASAPKLKIGKFHLWAMPKGPRRPRNPGTVRGPGGTGGYGGGPGL